MNPAISPVIRDFVEGFALADNKDAPSIVVDWKTIATKCAIVATVYAAVIVVQRRFFPNQRSVRLSARLNSERSSNRESGDELCPICLESPRNGVRPGCGHKLCATCLRRYFESLQRNNRPNCVSGPPPCPLCRTPLVSFTLTYDQINLPKSDCTVDLETVQWIEEYNRRNASDDVVSVEKTNAAAASLTARILGCNSMIFVKLLLASIVLGIYARSYNGKPFGIDLVVYSSFLVTALGMTLLVCLWLKCHDQADLEPDD
ncbi:uncharacterized protein LOC103317985 [Nasonia vitripennis]|uniref:RING-type domain-containing protein n=1 Tax=Nasonia vitripennis TaxID=7425 RepID=A0A7M7QZ19_NASVI|nr:uncharacterized protein LOC103317985 [Nasonia vitripennis]